MNYSQAEKSVNKSQLNFCKLEETSQILRSFIPCGKIALFADESVDFSKILKIKSSLKGFESYLALVRENENFSGIFSLPDEVRAVIAVGSNAVKVARYFCTLRGAYCIFVATEAQMAGAFEKLVNFCTGKAHTLYPANEPDAVILDLNFIKGVENAYGSLALCAVTHLEFEINSVFSGGFLNSCYQLIFNLSQTLNSSDIKGVLNLYYQLKTAQKQIKEQAPSQVFCKLLQTESKISNAQASYFTYVYFLKTYKDFFENANPRTFFVPDYANRIRKCARISGVDERTLFLKNKVPDIKKCDALLNTFQESRKSFSIKCETAFSYFEKIKEQLFSFGVKIPQIESEIYQTLFSITAELSDILSVQSLMRDFGLLKK